MLYKKTSTVEVLFVCFFTIKNTLNSPLICIIFKTNSIFQRNGDGVSVHMFSRFFLIFLKCSLSMSGSKNALKKRGLLCEI